MGLLCHAASILPRHSRLRIIGIVDPSVPKSQPLPRDPEFPGDRLGHEIPEPLRGLNGGVPGHEGNAAAVGPQVNGREFRVCGDQLNLLRLQAQDLGHGGGQHHVGTLTDLDGAAEEDDSPATINLQVDLRVRHVVPVDREARPAEVAAEGESDALAFRKPSSFLIEPGGLEDLLHTLLQTTARDPHPVARPGEGLDQVLPPELNGVHSQHLRHPIEVYLQGEPGLGCAVSPLGTARRLVGVDPQALELVGRDPVGRRLEGPRIVSGGDAVAPVGPAVEDGTEVHRRESTVLLHPRLHPHQRWVSSTMGVEDLLPC